MTDPPVDDFLPADIDAPNRLWDIIHSDVETIHQLLNQVIPKLKVTKASDLFWLARTYCKLVDGLVAMSKTKLITLKQRPDVTHEQALLTVDDLVERGVGVPVEDLPLHLRMAQQSLLGVRKILIERVRKGEKQLKTTLQAEIDAERNKD